jgi:hypothetical protein
LSAVGAGKKSATSGFPDRALRYLRSPSTRWAAFVGLLTYASYAYAHSSWANYSLIGVALFIGVFLPSYARLSNNAELWTNNRFGFVSIGRLGRFLPQFVFNLAVFGITLWGGALNRDGVASVGGIAVAALITTIASQGAQYVGLYLAQRGVGDPTRNVQFGLSANLVLTALATAGLPIAREIFLIGGTALGALVYFIGILSDIRSKLAPRRGVGMMFGTFNPFHNTHLDMIARAIKERSLSKVVIHPTIVPRIHADAFRKGEIEVARLQDGYQMLERTAKADSNVDYFPSGKQFLAPQTRKLLIELSVAEAGLQDRVEVAYYPEIYEKRGFQGVIAEIKRGNPGQPLHIIHGTDHGGMTVRQICDECGWIYPWRILRRDRVSATAIRRGTKGMTSTVVTEVLEQLAANREWIVAGGRRFHNVNGVLSEGETNVPA